MERLLAWSFLALTALVIGYMARQAYTGKRSLLSIRNFFLTGLILFQLTSAALAYFTGRYTDLPVADPVGTGLKFLFIITTFMIIFTVTYERAWFTFGIQRRFRMSLPVPGASALLTLSIVCLGVAAVLRFALSKLGPIGVLAEIGASAMAAMAAGAATWAWASRPKSLPLLVFMAVIIAVASVITLFEAFTRREIVSVVVGAMWGAYHGGFRHIHNRRATVPLTIIGVCGFLFVAAFTATRGDASESTPVAERVRSLARADLLDGAMQLLSGQDAAGNSLWVIENRPMPFPYDPLASLVYFAVHPIPRLIWENKPLGLGTLVVDQAMMTGRDKGFSLGVGLVGHMVNDNPWIAVPLYAILLAAWLRVLDDLLKRFPNHPYVILPLGIELGEIIGLARGEMGFFLFRAVAGMIMAYVGTLLVAKLVGAMGFSGLPQEAPEDVMDEDPEALSARLQE